MRKLALATLSLIALPHAARAGEGKDFIQEARLLYRVVACAGSDALPAHLDPKVVDAYCARLGQSMEQYKKNYVEGARSFIAAERPTGLPSTVVYPFAGGDLLSALTTYPDAKEITTVSLEHAGDPRRVHSVAKGRLVSSLNVIRSMGGGLLVWNDSKSETLMKAQRNEFPGEVSLFLIALAAHGFEPTALRYFRLEPDGGLHYYDEQEIAALEKDLASRLKSNWTPPDFSEAFSNSEIQFVPRGAPAGTPPRVHRHIAFNLGDDVLRKDPSLLAHLRKKGKVAAMTKAASYLLWYDSFSLIRDYLLENMEYMVSDSTGIPPVFAAKAGFVQDTFGNFEKSFLNANYKYNQQFRELWKKNPPRDLPFRYGYIDGSKRYHMLITRRPREGERPQ